MYERDTDTERKTKRGRERERASERERERERENCVLVLLYIRVTASPKLLGLLLHVALRNYVCRCVVLAIGPNCSNHSMPGPGSPRYHTRYNGHEMMHALPKTRHS